MCVDKPEVLDLLDVTLDHVSNLFTSPFTCSSDRQATSELLAFLFTPSATVTRPTCPDERLVGLVADQLGEPRPLGVDGLLHGLHPHPQVAVLRLQHGVLVKHVAEALHAVLARHALALDEKKNWNQSINYT